MSLTFARCVEIDPAIGALESLARRAAPAAGGDPDYRVFLLEVKPLVTLLVGWERGMGREDGGLLRTEEAYDVVYQHLADVIGGEA